VTAEIENTRTRLKNKKKLLREHRTFLQAVGDANNDDNARDSANLSSNNKITIAEHTPVQTIDNSTLNAGVCD
jgi:hypothetical protein